MAIDMNRTTTIALPDSLGLPHEDAGDYLIIGLASAGDRKAIAAKAAALTVGCVECAAPEQEPTKVVNTLNFVQKAKDGSRFSTHCRLYSGALSGTRTLGPLIKSQLLYQLS